jgi:hypothetical protein
MIQRSQVLNLILEEDTHELNSRGVFQNLASSAAKAVVRF